MRLRTFIETVRLSLIEAKIDAQMDSLRASFIDKLLKIQLERKITILKGATAAQRGNHTDVALDAQIAMIKRCLSGDRSEEASTFLKGYVKTFQNLVEADPSQNKKYMAWIIRWALGKYSQNDWHIVNEDLPKVHGYLDILNRGLVKGFDINSVKTLPDLYKVVQPHLAKANQPTNRELEQIMPETNVVYDGPEGKIVSPLSMTASIIWGRGTEWCTAWTGTRLKNNMFKSYSRPYDPLYVIILPDGEKYQLHLGGKQFMDADDRPVQTEQFIVNHPWVVPALNITADKVLRMITEKNRHDPDDEATYGPVEVRFTKMWMPREEADDLSYKLFYTNPMNLTMERWPDKVSVDAAMSGMEARVRKEARYDPETGQVLSTLMDYMAEKNVLDRDCIRRFIQMDGDMYLAIPKEYRHERESEDLMWLAIRSKPSVIIRMYHKAVPGITSQMYEYAAKADPKVVADIGTAEGGNDMRLFQIGLQSAFAMYRAQPNRNLRDTIIGLIDMLDNDEIVHLLRNITNKEELYKISQQPLLVQMVFGQPTRDTFDQYHKQRTERQSIPF